MSVSYIPTLKDNKGNKIIGLMGQFDDREDAVVKLYGNFIFWIPFNLTTAGITEYDSEKGLPHFETKYGGWDCGVIAGPMFDELLRKHNDKLLHEDHTGSTARTDNP